LVPDLSFGIGNNYGLEHKLFLTVNMPVTHRAVV